MDGWVDLHAPHGVRLDMEAAVPLVVAAAAKIDPATTRRNLGIDPYIDEALRRHIDRLGGDPLIDPRGKVRTDTREGIPYLIGQGGRVAEWATEQFLPWREARTLHDTLSGCVTSARANNGYVRPRVEMTVTGRAALRGAPIHGLPRGVRHLLLPAQPGWQVAQLDYSAYDWRVTAALCGDAQLVADCAGDPLGELAAALGCQRDVAKRVSYGLAYGSGSKLMAAQLGVDIGEADRLRAAVADRWPQWAVWRERLLASARITGVVRTGDGRLLPCARQGEPSWAGTHRAVAYAVQGTGAAVLAAALLALRRQGIVWALTWHDAVYLAGPAAQIEEAVAAAVAVLTAPPSWLPGVDLRVKVAVADTFAAGL